MKKLAERLRVGADGATEEAAKFFDNVPEPPDGYELTGEYRNPGESFFLHDGGVTKRKTSFCAEYPILRPILRPIPPTFAVGSYVEGDDTVYLVITRDEYLEKWTEQNAESAVWFMRSADGKIWKCTPEFEHLYKPWLPKKGEEVWVDGEDLFGSPHQWPGVIKDTPESMGGGSASEQGKDNWEAERTDGSVWNYFCLGSLAPLAFAPKEEPKPDLRAMFAKIIENWPGTNKVLSELVAAAKQERDRGTD